MKVNAVLKLLESGEKDVLFFQETNKYLINGLKNKVTQYHLFHK